MRFSFHPEAEAELREAVDYYEQVESGLGLDFAASSSQRHTKGRFLAEGVANDGRRNSQVVGEAVSLWCAVCGGGGLSLHLGRHAPSPTPRILETPQGIASSAGSGKEPVGFPIFHIQNFGRRVWRPSRR